MSTKRMINILPEDDNDSEEVDMLLDLVFGTGRETLNSYRFRDGIKPVQALSYVLRDRFGILVGTIRFWPIFVGLRKQPSLFLGPLGVHPTRQGEGLGEFLVETGVKKAKNLGWSRVLLIGDLAYYRRVGFSRELVKEIYVDDKISSTRILGRELIEGAFSGLRGPILRAD